VFFIEFNLFFTTTFDAIGGATFMEQAELVHQYPTRITEYSAIPNFQLNIPSNQKVQTTFSPELNQ
jgi:hypothetical protein